MLEISRSCEAHLPMLSFFACILLYAGLNDYPPRQPKLNPHIAHGYSVLDFPLLRMWEGGHWLAGRGE